jgi:sugar phosphate isomerase/epimerase
LLAEVRGDWAVFPSIVTDEISADPETAFELGLEWGVQHFELRGVHDARVPRLTPYARQKLLRAVREFGVTITAISPGLFKCPFPDTEPARSNLGWMDAGLFRSWHEARGVVDDHLLNLLPDALEFAGELGATYLIAFSFHRAGRPGGEAPAGVIDTLAQAAETAGSAGIDLLIENEEGHWADTGRGTARLVERVGVPALGVNWDPANALIEGDVAYPDGFAAVKDTVRNVHFKDARLHANGSWEVVADGDVDWNGQIAALAANGYSGAVAVEPHLSPPLASARTSLAKLRGLIEAARRREKNLPKGYQPNG